MPKKQPTDHFDVYFRDFGCEALVGASYSLDVTQLRRAVEVLFTMAVWRVASVNMDTERNMKWLHDSNTLLTQQCEPVLTVFFFFNRQYSCLCIRSKSGINRFSAVLTTGGKTRLRKTQGPSEINGHLGWACQWNSHSGGWKGISRLMVHLSTTLTGV